MENDVIAMAANLLNAEEGVVGCFTYGGTESIMLALKAAREKFRKERGADSIPEIILPVTAHPAFWKSAEYLGYKVISVAVDDDLRSNSNDGIDQGQYRNYCWFSS